jgi:hypothetical protein
MMSENEIVNYRLTRSATRPGEARNGRAIRYDGTAYAVTSQAATDALNPWATGGHLRGTQERETGADLSIFTPNTGYIVRGIAAGNIAIGEAVRPAYNADAALNDRYASVVATALPGSAGTYFTTGRALTAAAAGGEFWFQLTVERTVVVGG